MKRGCGKGPFSAVASGRWPIGMDRKAKGDWVKELARDKDMPLHPPARAGPGPTRERVENRNGNQAERDCLSLAANASQVIRSTSFNSVRVCSTAIRCSSSRAMRARTLVARS